MSIRVLIVDDIADTRANIRRLLEFESDIDVVGEAKDGVEAVAKARELAPDCILMDINMPHQDGIAATEQISVDVPASVIVIMSVQGEQEYLRKAMLAGARDYLIKPFASEELVSTLRRACNLEALRRKKRGLDPSKREPGKIISVFSTKGGVGKTTIATNLSVLLAQQGAGRIALVDLDLQFGDVPVLLDVVPSKTLAELSQEGEIDAELVYSYLTHHISGVNVMAAPNRPEEAELIRPEHVGKVLDLLREQADYIIIDMPQGFHENVLASLDKSDHILFLVTLDVPTVKNARLGMEVMNSLSYESSRIAVILNQYSQRLGIPIKVVEENLKSEVAVRVPYEPDVVLPSVNEGRPFVMAQPDATVTKSLREIAALVGIESTDEPKGRGLLRFLKRAT